MARAEGNRILETQVNGTLVYGLGLGALEGRLVALLSSSTLPVGRLVDVQILDASTDPIAVTQASVTTYCCGDEVAADATDLHGLVDASVSSGQVLLERASEVFPHLRIDPRAADAFSALTGAEPVFQQLIRHLRALNSAADAWAAGAQYQPQGITFSPRVGPDPVSRPVRSNARLPVAGWFSPGTVESPHQTDGRRWRAHVLSADSRPPRFGRLDRILRTALSVCAVPVGFGVGAPEQPIESGHGAQRSIQQRLSKPRARPGHGLGTKWAQDGHKAKSHPVGWLPLRS